MSTSFILTFLFKNLLLTLPLALLILMQRILVKRISARLHYCLWFLMLGLLCMPFLSIQAMKFSFSLPVNHANISALPSVAGTLTKSGQKLTEDICYSAGLHISSTISAILLFIWIAGSFVMLFLTILSILRLIRLEKSSLPVQNGTVRGIFNKCLSRIKIRQPVTLYSSAFLNTPITVGILRPRIYFPISMMNNLTEHEIEYILLHELQHISHFDGIINYLMTCAGIIYWFNPLVHYSLLEMRNARELACDAAVLALLSETDYVSYGNTLINFAEKQQPAGLPLAAGMGGSKKQIKTRILHIASFKKLSFKGICREILLFLLLICTSLCCAPFLVLSASDSLTCELPENVISCDEVSSLFSSSAGSFVLYDENSGLYHIYNKEEAVKRISPDSTYKIYSALAGLESGSITPADSAIRFTGTESAISSWNQDQDLTGAMKNSVNWYFEKLDERTGLSFLKQFFHKISYGNENFASGLTDSWKESSLKIAPIEQVNLLRSAFSNTWNLKESSINTVKDSMLLSSDSSFRLYGKTGTGVRKDSTCNGWFVGCVETADNTYYFALNLQGDSLVNGPKAAELAIDCLNSLAIHCTLN